MSDVRTAALRLNCRPSKAGNVLMFPYTLENQGSDEVYAMHALPAADPASGAARANETAAIVIASDNGDAIIGKFAAPLPTDRRIAVAVLPLARRVPAGASLEGRIEIALPLAETSPYFPDLLLRGYEIVEIKGVQLTIGYWLAGRDGLAAIPAEYAPDLFVVVTRNTMRNALRVSRRYPTTGLQLFRRTDAFPRALS
ncbi:MAG TPA: hypothetical protein VJX94_08305 [Stellaceae bacterium]|nr:hypothetical protein [Stellaceae bacterium]